MIKRLSIHVLGTARTKKYSTSSNSSAVQDYSRALLKKFLFQTHPDFFENYEAVQTINSTNLRYLQSLIEDPMSVQNAQAIESARTLTFYLKCTEESLLIHPRKVNVSLSRVLDSMAEILEAVGVDLPQKPQGYISESVQKYYSNFSAGNSSSYGPRHGDNERNWLSSETKAIITFLESLPDRNDILLIKQELFQSYKRIEAMVIEVTGISEIEYRNSWSMQNNALLLQQLLLELKTRPEKFSLPWTGMKIVFSVEHGYIGPRGQSAVAIDYLEGVILIDCIEVSATWIDKLKYISQEEIQKAEILRESIEQMRVQCEPVVQQLVTSFSGDKLLHNDLFHSPEVKVTIRRGYTCNARDFGKALQVLLASVNNVIPLGTSHQNISDESTSKISYHEQTLLLPVCVENSHGTKVLKDGTLRVDVNLFLSSSPDALKVMLKNRFGDNFLLQTISSWLSLAKKQRKRELEINTLRDHLRCVLELSQLRMGLGVNQDMFLRFLRAATQYLDIKNQLSFITGNLEAVHRNEIDEIENETIIKYGGETFDNLTFEQFYYPHYEYDNSRHDDFPPAESEKLLFKEKKRHCRIKNRGILKHLSGFSLTIGHHAGITEDGTCVLPWNFALQQLTIFVSNNKK